MSLRLDGLQELRDALGKLPEEFQRQAGDIILDHANTLRTETQADYPVRQTNLHPGPNRKTPFYPPGNLRRGVTVNLNRSTFGVSALVRSQARHAWLFENGSNPRQTKTGANRGQMPRAVEAERMIPKAIRIRRQMILSVVEMVKSAGFEVTVD